MLVVFGAFTCIFVGLEQRGFRSALMTSGSSLLDAGLRAAARPAVGLRRVLRGRDRPRAARAADRVPPDDLQHVLAARDRRHRSRDPGRDAADAGRACSCARTTPGSSTSSTASGRRGPQWFTEVQETHTSYGSLAFFRSPNPHRSWVTAAGAVLDTASVRLAVVDIPWTPAAAICIRSGYLALREVAGFFGFDYDDVTRARRPDQRHPRRVRRALRRARRRGRSGPRRSRQGLARLRGLAGQLRPGARHARCAT